MIEENASTRDSVCPMGRNPTPLELKSNLVGFLAGVGNSARLVAVVIEMFSRQQEMQTRFLVELHQVFGDVSLKEAQERARRGEGVQIDRFDYDRLMRLEYLKCFIHECLRMYPPSVSVAPRSCSSDNPLGEYTIPSGTWCSSVVFENLNDPRYHSLNLSKSNHSNAHSNITKTRKLTGTTVMCNIYGSHHHPNYWTRPDRFDPMRFSVTKDRAQHRPATPAFFPFGYGGHSCIGKNLAQIATMTIAAKLVASFQLLPKPGTRSPKFNTTNSTQIFGFMEPIGGVWIQPTRRSVMRSGKRSRDSASEETRRSQRAVTSKRLTWDEIRTHTTQDSCWIVLNDKVYDVTPFLSVHPGGKRILLGQAGKDATSMFKAIAHSTFAVEESDKYYIGDVNGERVRDVARL